MSQIILFNKPCGVLTQFTSSDGKPCLKDFIDVPGVYAAGRLDADSEGLVVLTNDGALQALISNPRHKLEKTYWVQVEGEPDQAALDAMRRGLDLGDFHSAPCGAERMAQPAAIWPRDPPIRYRAAIPTTWLQVTLREGKNRQVRRMTAKVGFPTLRLVRWAVGEWTLAGLIPGAWRRIELSAISPSRPRAHRRPATADFPHYR